jgi:hypothetical protein
MFSGTDRGIFRVDDHRVFTAELISRDAKAAQDFSV